MAPVGAFFYMHSLARIRQCTDVRGRVVACNELCQLLGIAGEEPKPTPYFTTDPNQDIYVRLMIRIMTHLGESYTQAVRLVDGDDTDDQKIHYSPCALPRTEENTATIVSHGYDAVRHWKLGDEVLKPTCACDNDTE